MFFFPSKDKKGVTIVNAFQIILDSWKRKLNKIWIDQGSEFYSNSFKKWLKDNDIEKYSTYDGGKSLLAQRFIRALKNQIYKNTTAVSKNVYFDVLDNTVVKYNKTYHNTIKMKPIDVKSNFYTKYNVDSNDKDITFKISVHVRISKYKNLFVISKIKNTVSWIYIINDINGE